MWQAIDQELRRIQFKSLPCHQKADVGQDSQLHWALVFSAIKEGHLGVMVHLRVLVFLGCVRNHHKSKGLKQHSSISSQSGGHISRRATKITDVLNSDLKSRAAASGSRRLLEKAHVAGAAGHPTDTYPWNLSGETFCGETFSRADPTQLLASYPVSGSIFLLPSLHCHLHLHMTSLEKPSPPPPLAPGAHPFPAQSPICSLWDSNLINLDIACLGAVSSHKNIVL